MSRSVQRVVAIPVILGALLLILAGSACSRNEPTRNEPTIVRFGTMGDAVDYAPYMVAKAKGWFEEAFSKSGGPVTTAYTAFQELPALNESIGAGRIDVIFEAEPPAIIGRAAGNDLRIVGISCSLTQEIVVRADAGIQDVAGLRGKRVSVPAGTSSHYNLLAILGGAGLTDTDLQIIDMSPPDAKNAFDTGQVDGWAIWPPWVEQEVVSGRGRVLPGGEARIHSIMSLRQGFQREHPALAQAAVDVLERTRAWIRQNPAESQDIVAKGLNLDRKIIELAWPKHDWSAQLGPEVISDIQAKADFLAKRGIIKTDLNVQRDLVAPMPSAQ